MRILTLCGSLRTSSSNRSLLRAYERLARPGMTIEHYERVGLLPHFNPDLDCDAEALPDEVVELRRVVGWADTLLISTPEYVHALPGSFKNALDWLVSDPAFAGKQVVILHASPSSTWALESLQEILRTMSAKVLQEASVVLPLGLNGLDEEAVLERDSLRSILLHSVEMLFDSSKVNVPL